MKVWLKFFTWLFSQESDVAMFIEEWFKTLEKDLIDLCEDNETMKEAIHNYFNGEKI